MHDQIHGVKIEDVLPIGIVIGVLYYLIRSVRDAKAPDPWDPEIEASIHRPDAVPVCHRCLKPQERRPDHWFCPECGAAVGPYNNCMPYVYIFSQGEALREGTSGRVRSSFVSIAGYFLFSITQYAILAPFYWYCLFKNLGRSRESATDDSEAPVEN